MADGLQDRSGKVLRLMSCLPLEGFTIILYRDDV